MDTGLLVALRCPSWTQHRAHGAVWTHALAHGLGPARYPVAAGDILTRRLGPRSLAVMGTYAPGAVHSGNGDWFPRHPSAARCL